MQEDIKDLTQKIGALYAEIGKTYTIKSGGKMKFVPAGGLLVETHASTFSKDVTVGGRLGINGESLRLGSVLLAKK
jgi:hypothetical protein